VEGKQRRGGFLKTIGAGGAPGLRMENWADAVEGTQTVASAVDPYTVEVDQIDEDGWNGILPKFDDANLLQTWSYGAVRWGQSNLRHIVLRQNGEVISSAQVVIKTIPLLGTGVAYVKWGPLWQPRGMARDPQILRKTLRELRRVYVKQRGLLLRISPADRDDTSGALRGLFQEEGFERDSSSTRQTALVDLSYSLDELRGSLRPTWRRNLVLAERRNLSIVSGTGMGLFDVFARLYREMLPRKDWVAAVSISRFTEIQRELPETLKMRIMLCEFQGEPIAGLVVPSFGKTALNLLAATVEKGLKFRASYFLQWHMLRWLKEQGCRWYDLDLIDQRGHPGITQFKSGLAGRLGSTPEYLGQFESCGRPLNRVSVEMGSRLSLVYKRVQRRTQRVSALASSLVSGRSVSGATENSEGTSEPRTGWLRGWPDRNESGW
jgi:lipid II:glycine glycyltransferase (peptidoglycan interpeptide bridge formation enzyme)